MVARLAIAVVLLATAVALRVTVVLATAVLATAGQATAVARRVTRAAVSAVPSSHVQFFPGTIAEYRSGDGRLIGVMTAVTDPATQDLCLQHVMLWPGVEPAALIRMLRDVEVDAWRYIRPPRIFLDIEHAHPSRDALRAVAERRGFKFFYKTDTTTWYVKEREG